ncbi:MAG: helicase-related protein [bacterium]
MKILIKDKYIAVADATAFDKQIIKERFLYYDTSQAMSAGGYNKNRVKKVYFASEKKDVIILKTGFLKELFELIKKEKLKVEAVDDRRTKFEHQEKEYTWDDLRKYFNPKFDYVDHQIRALRALLKTTNGIIKAPTSAGKSEIIIALLKTTNLPALILVDSISLAQQTVERINEAGVDCGIISSKGNIKGYNMVSTIGSYKKIGDLTRYKMIIVDECFPGKTLVHTENGKKTISSLVKSKSSEKVWSFNETTKKYELKEIYNWFEKKTEYNEFVKIWYNNRDSVKSTPNHKYWILNNKEIIQKRADELIIGDRSLVKPSYSSGTGIAPSLSKKQYQAVLGMILGDGSLSKFYNLARLRFSHEKKQLDYLNYKLLILNNMYFRKNLIEGKSGYDENKIVYNIATQSSLDFLDLYNKFYKNGVKFIYNIIKEIDEISLAFWVMDDGCLHNKQYYELSTHSFSEEENKKIIEVLKIKFDIDAKLKFDKRINKWYLYITTKSSKKLSELISPYVCDSMQYKLFEKDRGKFNFVVDDKVDYGIKEIKNIEKIIPEYKTVYNISVKDNHNYLVGNDILVSNCHGAAAKRFLDFFDTSSYPIRFGFSATPSGNDKYRFALVRSNLGPIIEEIYSEELLENNVITEPEIHFKTIKCKPTLDWQTAYEINIVYNEERNKKIIELEKKQKVPTLILYKIIKHGEELHKEIPNSILLSGEDSLSVREEAVKKFKNGEVNTLIASNIFKQGISINNIQTLIVASGGKSKIEVLQRIGRALRKHPGKDYALVYDFIDEGNEFTERHSYQRMNLYKKTGFKNIVIE